MTALNDPPASTPPPRSPHERPANLARWYATTWTTEGDRWRRVLASIAFIAAVIIASTIDDRGAWTTSLMHHPLAALALSGLLAAWVWLEVAHQVRAETRTRKALLAVRVLMWLGVLVAAGPPRSLAPAWAMRVWAGALVADAALSFRRSRDWLYAAAAFVALAALLLWWAR